ncbi:PucR family transcriptional regulator [Cohnella caldifontis]|uniref:PucR family transcriptional regulator n=1 Tax=Cohnella caldifontis TaxID=3027471 RepID=UPI0023EB9D8D|nr:helix-turn-helix domain-containing protein [Cohnella sp. YIM B05605]
MASLPRKEMFQDPSVGRQKEGSAERTLPEEVSQLTSLQHRIQALARLLLEGAGLIPLLDAIETMLNNPVAVVRENGKSWLSVSLRGAASAETRPIPQSLTARSSISGRAGGFTAAEGTSPVYATPLTSPALKPATLVLIARNKEISPLDTLSIDRMAALVGLELENAETVREVESKYLGHFLQDWLSGKIPNESDWRRRADLCGWSVPEGKRICAARVGWRKPLPSADKLREAAFRLREEWADRGLLAAPADDDLALVVPLPANAKAEDAEASAERILRELLADLRAMFGVPELRLYAGRAAERPEDLPASWMQASRARRVAEVCGVADDVLVYGKLGVYTLLYMIPDGEEREQFLRRFSHPLKQADRKGGGRLSETLEMYFRCNGNIKLTSEKLYAHYNTVVYRLEKIQNILGVSLDDPEDRLQLHLALKLGMMNAAHRP